MRQHKTVWAANEHIHGFSYSKLEQRFQRLCLGLFLSKFPLSLLDSVACHEVPSREDHILDLSLATF